MQLSGCTAEFSFILTRLGEYYSRNREDTTSIEYWIQEYLNDRAKFGSQFPAFHGKECFVAGECNQYSYYLFLDNGKVWCWKHLDTPLDTPEQEHVFGDTDELFLVDINNPPYLGDN